MFRLHPNSFFEDGTGAGLEPVGGEFQPSFETVHPGGGAHHFSVLHFIFVLNYQYDVSPKKARNLVCYSCGAAGIT
jgi:hypothetical protein